MEEEKLICPMSMSAEVGNVRACHKEKCAWWCDLNEYCAIKEMTLSLGRISSTLKAIAGKETK